MNDLLACVKDVNVTMYADDTSLDKAIGTLQELREELVPAFEKVCEWLKSNKLSLNAVKTEFMIIGTPHRLNLEPTGWLNVRSLIKLNLGVFVYKELHSLHPERDFRN